MPPHEGRALLVDLDGVIISSQGAQDRAWTWWCNDHGLKPGRFVAAHGLTGVEKIRQFAPHLDAFVEADRITNYEVSDTDGVTPVPGATELAELGCPFVIVTSAAERLARARLRAAGLSVPTYMISADTVSRSKPDPEPYLAAAALLGVKPAACTVIEDAPAGVASGLAAGMEVVALRTTVGPGELSDADVIFRSLESFLLWWRGRRASVPEPR